MGTSRHLWIRDLLVELGVKGSLENALALVAQCQAEGSPSTSRGGGARFNPLNCSVSREGSTDYNTIPVQNYVSFAQGLEATASMLRQANMRALLIALQKGDSALDYWYALGKSPWGTRPPAGYTVIGWLDDARAHWYARAMIPIAGT